jgi:hypothetical protein
MNGSYRTQFVTDIITINSDSYYSLAAFENLFNLYKNTYDEQSGSDLGDISEFVGTDFAEGFINSMKGVVNTLSA